MLSSSFPLLFIFFLSFIFSVKAEHDIHNGNVHAEASESSHTNNWAVLVCASRYWFNYRVRIVGLYLCILYLKKCFWMIAYGEYVRNVRLMIFPKRERQ